MTKYVVNEHSSGSVIDCYLGDCPKCAETICTFGLSRDKHTRLDIHLRQTATTKVST